MFFKKKNTKNKYVVKQRTRDNYPYCIPHISSFDDSKDDSTHKTISPIYGTSIDNSKNAFVAQSNEDISNRYKEFSSNPSIRNEELYKGFASVNIEPKTEASPKVTESITPKIVETPQMIKEEPQAIKEEPKFYTYENETKTTTLNDIDDTTLNTLFGVEKETPKEVKQEVKVVKEPIQTSAPKERPSSPIVERYQDYIIPPLTLLNEAKAVYNESDDEWNQNNISILNKFMMDFHIDGEVKEHTMGPTFTRYAIMLGSGVSGSRIQNLENDIQRVLGSTSIRIENPIPGKTLVGIEVPNRNRRTVTLKELLSSEEFIKSDDPLLIPVGLDVEGKARYVSINKLPHGIVAGASGSGKSVFITCLVASLLFRNKPDELKFFFIDPKKVDLSQFSGLPHLLSPIVDSTKEAIASLKWISQEMEKRYMIFNQIGVPNLYEYNIVRSTEKDLEKIPFIVVIIEEAGDFMLEGGNEADALITKLVQKSRAAGIYIILAMQKPIAKILSTAIKSNASGRFAFSVPQYTDSMIIIDSKGAESLLGNGDMMFYLSGNISRYQSAFMSVDETRRLKKYIMDQSTVDYTFEPENLLKRSSSGDDEPIDELFYDVARYVVNHNYCSTNDISRNFNIGFNRADSIVRNLDKYCIISKSDSKKASEILVDLDQLEELLEKI